MDAQLGIRYCCRRSPFSSGCWPRGGAGGPAVRADGSALAAWHVVSVLSYHPHYMSYFNELIGRRIDAWRFLADSNLDWKDRQWFIRRFQARHPEMPLVHEQ